MTKHKPNAHPESVDEPAADQHAAPLRPDAATDHSDMTGELNDGELDGMVELLDRVKLQTPEMLSDIFECDPVLDENNASRHGAAVVAASRSASESLNDMLAPSAAGETIRIGNFEIIEQVGFGGSGVVFRARDARLKRTVALKIPHPEALMTTRLRERFVREAEAAAALDHPHVVPVYEAGTEGVVSYIAYAFFEGQTLYDWLATLAAPPDERLVARIVKAVAEGLQHAHDRGVLHRDIKPSNVMIAFDEVDDSSEGDRQSLHTGLTVRITDFGMARIEADDVEATRTGTILGTPAYMAPEQSRGASQVLGPAADVYSLGALLYELLTCRPPFERDNVVDLLQAVRQTMPTPPSRVRPDVSRDLEVLTMRCLDKAPQARLPSAGFLADELQRFLDDKSILSRPDSTPTALVKWSRRHPLIASLTASLMLVAVLGIAGVTWQWRKAARALFAVSRAEREKATLLDETAAQLHVRRVGLAHREILDGRHNRARRILVECDPRRRAWDWHYLNGLSRQEQKCWHEFVAHPRDISWDSTGNRLLIVECVENLPQKGGRWSLIDLATGEVVRDHLFEHGGLYGCAFAPDGKTFVTSAQLTEGTERTLTMWDAATGDELWHAGVVSQSLHVAYSGDGHWIASAGLDGTIRVWSVEGKLLAAFDQSSANILQVDFHPRLPLLAAACRDGTLGVWNVETEQLEKSIQLTSDLRCARFSPSGRWLGVAGYGGCVEVLDVQQDYQSVFSGRNTLSEMAGIYAVEFSGDERRLLGVSTNGEAYLWDLETGALTSQFSAHAEAIFDCLWIDSTTFATCSELAQEVKLWDSAQTGEPKAAYPHVTETSDMAIGPSGNVGILATAYNRFFGGEVDYRLKVIDLKTLETVGVLSGHDAWHTAVAISSDERRVASADVDGRVIVWDLTHGDILFELERASPAVIEVAFSANDQELITVSRDGRLGRWDSQTGLSMEVDRVWDGQLHAAIVNRDASELFIADNGKAALWSLNPMQRLSDWNWDARSLRGSEPGRVGEAMIVELAFDESRNFVAIAEPDRVHCWSRGPDGTVLIDQITELYEAADRITAIAFNPDGQRIAVGNDNTTVRLWDTVSGLETITLRAHSESRGPISECRFSPDGRRLFACRTFITTWEASHASPETRRPQIASE